jgi:hypothetical protein
LRATIALVRLTLAAAHSRRFTSREKTRRSQAVRNLRASASPGGASRGTVADFQRRTPQACQNRL